MTTAKSCCFTQDKNIDINNETAKSQKRLEVSRYFGLEGRIVPGQNIGTPQVVFLFAVLLFMCIHNFARVCPKQGTSFARVSPNRVLILREFLLTGYIISREFPFNRVYNFARVFQAKQGI